MKSWIFQGNPDHFRIDEYISDFDEIVWAVRQENCAKRISIGDEVFIWRAAGRKKTESGVIARGIVLTMPAKIHGEPEGKYWVNDPVVAERRVRLQLTDKLLNKKQFIKGRWLEDDPVLRDLIILRFQNATNFKVTNQQARRLRELCARTGADWSREESLAGLWLYQSLIGKSISKRPDSPVAMIAVLVGRPVTGVYNKVMNFRAIDPRDERKGLSDSAGADKAVWSEFYDPDSETLDTNRLDEEFKRIWRKELSESEPDELDYQREVSPPKKDLEKYRGKVPAKTKKRSSTISIKRAPPRNASIGELALEGANYLCEVNDEHTTFQRDDGKQFMEKHHLIPMEFYGDFDRSIDHQSNITSLCPTCHRMIHLGLKKDRRAALRVLIDKRLGELKKYYNVDESDIEAYYKIS